MTRFKKLCALLLVCMLVITAGALTVNAQSVDSNEAKADASKIVVHYKGDGTTLPYIYYWNSLPVNISTDYPGEAMTPDGTQVGENWYTYTFTDLTKVNMVFTDKDGNQLSGELTRTNDNYSEWWYRNGRWTSYNPDDVIRPSEYSDMREDSIYFVMTTRFYDGDTGNNVHCWDDGQAGNPDSDPAWRGDFKGLIEKLDYIKALGFTTVWVTPVVTNASGYDYHGYHAMDFTTVDARYESEGATYQDLIDAIHEKDMKIVQDVVWNHTGNFGETFFCHLFDKDLNADLSNLEESMIPTDYLLDSFGLDSAEEYWAQTGSIQYQQRLMLMKNTSYSGGNGNSTGTLPSDKDYGMNKLSDSDVYNANNYYHSGYFQSLNWDDWTCKYCQIAGDCVDLNTENPAVAQYTTNAYSDYINMGVDGFRVDTVRHIPRVVLNLMYNPQLMQAASDMGNEHFYMFGEICTRYTEVWYRGHAEESSPYYTWAESNDKWASAWSWGTSKEDINNNMNLTFDHYLAEDDPAEQPTSDNAFLNGITYHEPDTSQASGMGAIDFQMHRLFASASGAFDIAKKGDKYYNDATYNVVYVDSHDYAPEGYDEKVRFDGGRQVWAENLDLMFSFRGIPCVFYGSEVEFQKGMTIDNGPNQPLSTTGRAYFGDYLEGDVTATDFSEYTASGTVADTLNAPLSQHLTKLNAIRRAIPALQKGQYTTSSTYVSGNMAYIRRYTDSNEGVDSLALVTISNGATFKNIPNGKYIDAVTGDVKTVTDGTLTVPSLSKSNMRVYVCCAQGFTGIDGAIGKTDLNYLN